MIPKCAVLSHPRPKGEPPEKADRLRVAEKFFRASEDSCADRSWGREKPSGEGGGEEFALEGVDDFVAASGRGVVSREQSVLLCFH